MNDSGYVAARVLCALIVMVGVAVAGIAIASWLEDRRRWRAVRRKAEAREAERAALRASEPPSRRRLSVVPSVRAVPSAPPPGGIPARSFKSYEPPPPAPRVPGQVEILSFDRGTVTGITATDIGFGDLVTASDPSPPDGGGGASGSDFTGGGGDFGGSGASGDT